MSAPTYELKIARTQGHIHATEGRVGHFCGSLFVKTPEQRQRAEAMVRDLNDNARLRTVNEALVKALESIQWKSADGDNMEFAASITYVQMDAICAALKLAKGEG